MPCFTLHRSRYPLWTSPHSVSRANTFSPSGELKKLGPCVMSRWPETKIVLRYDTVGSPYLLRFWGYFSLGDCCICSGGKESNK